MFVYYMIREKTLPVECKLQKKQANSGCGILKPKFARLLLFIS